MVFVLFLGATCKRVNLYTDFMISVKVSAVHFLLLAGIYVSSMSSCLGAMYGTPRVLQSIAKESVIPGIDVLGKGVSGRSNFYFLRTLIILVFFYITARPQQSSVVCNGRCCRGHRHLHHCG